jgi:hypothetical protein
MAVPIEFISVVIPVQTIEERFHGGLARFREILGDGQTDGKLVRLGGMSQMAVSWIINDLERGGLKGIHVREGKEYWLDFCVVDSCSGPTLPCDWIKVELKKGEAHWHVPKEKGTSKKEKRSVNNSIGIK